MILFIKEYPNDNHSKGFSQILVDQNMFSDHDLGQFYSFEFLKYDIKNLIKNDVHFKNKQFSLKVFE